MNLIINVGDLEVTTSDFQDRLRTKQKRTYCEFRRRILRTLSEFIPCGF
jgi:hypothetical protein